MASFAVNQCNGCFYLQYQKVIETYDNLSMKLTNKFMSERFTSCRNSWLYCKNLVGHYGCVNAIEFSKKGGEYLVSGGDDTRVLVWKLGEAMKGPTTPRCLKRRHLSNIFCASFDSENRHIISAGNDDEILRHDFETGEMVSCLTANDATYDICFHPENDNIFITAGEHGVVDLYDVRAPSEQVKLAQGPPTFHSAIYNPVDPAVFATASSVMGVELWDARMPLRRLKRFDIRAGIRCAMGVAFDQTGRYLTAVQQKLPPVLYHIDRNTSLIEFHQEGYFNSCTMKSVCFAGKNDNFIISGSDDFNVYVWEVPKVDKDYEGIAKVDNSFLVLKGHRSIVNQVCFNKDTSMLCTAGVEKIVKMWSPFPLAGCQEIPDEDEREQRTPYSRFDYARMIIESGRPLAHDYEDQSTSEDPRMIAFFDTLVQREQDGLDTTDSYVSSTDDEDGEQSVSNVEILQRIRTIFFEQVRNGREELGSEREELGNGREDLGNEREELGNEREELGNEREELGSERERLRNEREELGNEREELGNEREELGNESGNPNEENASDNDRVESPERRSETDESQPSEIMSFTANSDENIDESEEEEGVGLRRLREIIASQQDATNARKRIAELRRNCLRNDDEEIATTSANFSECEQPEKNSKAKWNKNKCDVLQCSRNPRLEEHNHEKYEDDLSSKDDFEKHENSLCSEDNFETTKCKDKITRGIKSSPKCSDDGVVFRRHNQQSRLTPRLTEHVSDSSSEDDIETNNCSKRKHKESTKSSATNCSEKAMEFQHCEDKQSKDNNRR